MSAFMCSDAHISVLVNAAVEHGIGLPVNAFDPDAQFRMLVIENERSLKARYGERAFGMIGVGVHRFTPGPSLPAVHVLKLAQSYEYQACEHDGWETSIAKKWIGTLIAGLVYEIPGYDAAPWSI
jgi:hypothetical protein